jgi:hypothetical protein
VIANIILGLALGVLVTSAVSFGRWSARRDIRRQDAREAAVDAAEVSRALATSRDFADSKASGYVDCTGLENDRA